MATLNQGIKASTVRLSGQSQNIVHPPIVKGLSPWPLHSTGRGPTAIAGTSTNVRIMEKHHESAYRCSRVGHADCQPDLRSDRAHRQQSDLWRLRLGTKLPLVMVNNAAWARTSGSSPRDGSTMRPARCRPRSGKFVRGGRVACLARCGSWRSLPPRCWPRLHSPAGQRASANQLRPVPNWIDGSGALDRARQHSY